MASRNIHRAKAPGLRRSDGSMWRQSMRLGCLVWALLRERSHSNTFTPPNQASKWALYSRTFSR
jgi:hypothetical protein